VIPGSKRSEVAEANDLNPRKVRVFRYTRRLSSSAQIRLPSPGPARRGAIRGLRQVVSNPTARYRQPWGFERAGGKEVALICHGMQPCVTFRGGR
jgi:hypothetical protein